MTAYDPANVFARILRGELPCEKLYEDAHALSFMDIMPRADGHALVIPKVAARNILDIDASAFAAMMPAVHKVARAVMRGLGAEGLTIEQFSEPGAGQVVFHLHVHILPRWKGVALRPHMGQMEKPELLKARADRIRAALA